MGHILLDVDGRSLRGLEHKEACRLIAESFKNKRREVMEFHVMEGPSSKPGSAGGSIRGSSGSGSGGGGGSGGAGGRNAGRRNSQTRR